MSKYRIKVKDKLDKVFIPDISKLILSYLSCTQCKTMNEGLLKCICYKYMCKCNGKILCNDCMKVVCINCNKDKYCCQEPNQSCSYCGKFFVDFFCIYDKCNTKTCKKCFKKLKGLCRGHYLLKKHHPEKYDGI